MCSLKAKIRHSWHFSSMDCLSTRICIPATSWDTPLSYFEENGTQRRRSVTLWVVLPIIIKKSNFNSNRLCKSVIVSMLMQCPRGISILFTFNFLTLTTVVSRKKLNTILKIEHKLEFYLSTIITKRHFN